AADAGFAEGRHEAGIRSARKIALAESHVGESQRAKVSPARVDISQDSLALWMEVLGIHFGWRGAGNRHGRLFQAHGLRRGSRIWHDGDGFAGQLESSVSRGGRFGWQDSSRARIQAGD